MSESTSDTLSQLTDTGLTIAKPEEDVRGRIVKDSDGVDVGKIEELIVDERAHTVRFLLVEHGGFLGIGQTKTFIPVEAITSVDEKSVHIGHTRAHVAGAPPYDPDLADAQTYHDSVYGYYGYTPFGDGAYDNPTFPYSLYGAPRAMARRPGRTDRR